MVPQLLGMYVEDGIGEPALKGANLSQQGNTKGKLVAWVVGGANGTKGGDMNVE